MDDFTHRMLARAEMRQKKLDGHLAGAGIKAQSRTPLNESENNIRDTVNRSSDDNLDKKKYRKEIVSDSDLIKSVKHEKINKENVSEPTLSSNTEDRLFSSNLLGSRNNSKSSLTRVSSEIPASPQSPHKTLNIQRDNFNMEIKLTTKDDVRVEVEIEERDSTEDDQDNTNDNGGLRCQMKSKLQRLGKLYSGEEDCLSSPIHRTEEHFLEDEENTNITKSGNKQDDDGTDVKNKESEPRLRRLAALASTINQWEDDVHSIKTPSSKTVVTNSPSSRRPWKPQAPQPPIVQQQSAETTSSKKDVTIRSRRKSPAPQPPAAAAPETKKAESDSPTKSIKWDKKVLDTLESQGYTRTQSTARLVYNYSQRKTTESEDESSSSDESNKQIKKPTKHKKENKPLSGTTTKTPQNSNKSDNLKPSGSQQYSPLKKNTSEAILNKTSVFEGSPKQRDPALLSLSERKALFEKNKGEALIPKAAFAMAPPVKVLQQNKTVIKKDSQNANKGKVQKDEKPTVPESCGVAGKLQELLHQAATISETQILQARQQERQRELEMLRNRFTKNKEKAEDAIKEESESSEDEGPVTEATKMIPEKKKIVIREEEKSVPDLKRRSGDSPKVQAVLDDVKRVKIVPTRPGRLYPCLSDIETTATETDNNTTGDSSDAEEEDTSRAESNSADTSFGREILQAVCRNQANSVPKRAILDDSTESDLSDVLNEMDEYLNEQTPAGPTPPKQNKTSMQALETPSHSFNYKTSSVNCIKQNEDPVTPLMHTVSFYRKQQSQHSGNTPIRTIVREISIDEDTVSEPSTKPDEKAVVEQKIKQLTEELQKQQTVISQASQALNLCSSTIEFAGSREAAEAERLLLLATQRRQAALHELQRLRVERTLRPLGRPVTPDAKLVIEDLALPLKRDYVRALTAAGGLGHHLICLLRCEDQVVPTSLVATGSSASESSGVSPVVRIPGQLQLNDVPADFTAALEVYAMPAHEEYLPHEVKYHIGRKGATPKRLHKIPVQSPVGPSAVRTPSFQLVGYVVVSAGRDPARTQWTLNKVPYASPLEGVIHARLCVELSVPLQSYSGFLTMFEDVSGFGAWHRRWCRLQGPILNYWKYPDDEKEKTPMGSLDISDCRTQNVGLVSRDICARPHTMMLEFKRPRSPSDTSSLVTVVNGDTTTVRHLLSADTRDERIIWCDKFNTALLSIRSSSSKE